MFALCLCASVFCPDFSDATPQAAAHLKPKSPRAAEQAMPAIAAERALPGRWRCPLAGGRRNIAQRVEPGGGQISTLLPSSTTALLGRFMNSAALVALWCMCENSRSRQPAMPAPGVGVTMSRERK